LDLHVDVPHGRGRRAGIERALREAIRDGRLRPGDRLPSTRGLATDLGVARGTVVEAYSQLVAEGYLRSELGSGTVVGAVPAVPSAGAARVREPVVRADFRLGRADPSSFPRQDWLRALRHELRSAPDRVFSPAGPQGHEPLRTALAGYVGRTRGVRTEPDLMVVCGGFIQGFRLVCEVLRARGANTIAVEDPGLPDHRAVAAAAGLEVVSLPVDEHGARVDALDRTVDAVLLTPAHQAVLGSTLSAERRTAFARWAEESGAVIVEDDYDGEFRYDRHPIGALQALAPSHVVYIGSASKVLASSLRLGWLGVPPALRDDVVEAKRRADRGSGVLDQLALTRMIDSGALDRHIRSMRSRYRRRRDEVVAVVEDAIPGVRIGGVAAGLHLTASMPDGLDEAAFAAAADARSVALHGIGRYRHRPTHPGEGLVIGYGAPTASDFQPALRRLRDLLDEVVARG